MPRFTYTAIQPDATRVSGTVEAWSAQAAHDALKQMHLIPEEIKEIDEAASRIAAIPATEQSSSVPNPQYTNPQPPTTYFPLLDTLRLYAGWLVAWYCLVYALGSYQNARPLPFRIPYAEGLFLSPLVLSFTLAAFLFLLFTSLWKALGKGIVTGLILMIIGVSAFMLYRMNVL